MAAVDLYVLPHYWDSGYAEGEWGIKPYASGAEWWFAAPSKSRKDLIAERDAKLAEERQAAQVTPEVQQVIAQLAPVAAELASTQKAQNEALRAALRADGVKYRREHAAALAAYTAVWRGFYEALARQQVREREDEDRAVTLLLLH